MARPVPVWSGVVTSDGRVRLDARRLFDGYVKRLANHPVQLVLKTLSRRKSRGQMGYLWGVCYPIIAEELGYRQYEVEQVHDALMRKLRGLQPEPNPLQLRASLRELSHEDVGAYIDDLRFFAVSELGVVIPDPDKAEGA